MKPALDTLDPLLETIQSQTTATGLADYRLAREEYHHLTGEFEEGEPWFEIRMQMFMDWYLMERETPDGKTPIERFLESQGNHLSFSEKQILKNALMSLRSLFRIERVNESTMMLHDIIGGGRWCSKWTLPSIGLKKDDIVGTRIILCDDVLLAGRSAVLHPTDAHEKIHHIIARSQTEGLPRTAVVNYFDKVKLKLDRYSNVKIRHVYKYPSEAVF